MISFTPAPEQQITSNHATVWIVHLPGPPDRSTQHCTTHSSRLSPSKQTHHLYPPNLSISTKKKPCKKETMRSPSDPLLASESQPLPPGQIYLPDEDDENTQSTEPLIARCRRSARNYLSSRFGHYLVLFLVSVDVACVFADFLIEIHVCELEKKYKHVPSGWEDAQEALSITGLVFSCLFMLELVVAVGSFGMR